VLLALRATGFPLPPEGGGPQPEDLMEALLLRTSTTSRLPFAARYGLTTLLVLLVCAVRMMLGSLLTASPFLLFIPAVFLAAVLFNAGTALYATLLSAGLVVYFFVEPVGTLTLNTHQVAPVETAALRRQRKRDAPKGQLPVNRTLSMYELCSARSAYV
jgi:hypothetical protein